MLNRSHLLPYAAICRYNIYYPRFLPPTPDQVIVVPLGNYPEYDTYRFKREIRKELWLQHVANGHRYPQSHIFTLSPLQSRASETVKICAFHDRRSICELCRARMTRRFM